MQSGDCEGIVFVVKGDAAAVIPNTSGASDVEVLALT